MASLKTTLYNAQTNASGGSAASNYPAARQVEGKLRLARIPYALTGSEASSDTLSLVKLRIGDVVVPQLCSLYCEDPGTTLTLTVGDAGSANRYSTTITASAGGFFPFSSTPGAAALTEYAIASGNEDIVATLASVSSPTAAAKLFFVIAYVRNAA